MSDVVHNAEQEFWRPPVSPPAAPPAAAAPTMVEACDRCETEFMMGARYCHICGAARQAQGVSPAVRGWTRYLEFQSIEKALALPTASLIAFLTGIGCLVGVLVVGPVQIRGRLTPAKAASTITLNFLATDFPEYDAFVAAANAVGKPMGIEVKKTNVNFDDVQKKALLDFTSGVKTWDLIFLNSAWTPSFAARKVLTPIDDFLTSPEAKALVNPTDFVSATKQLMSHGKLYSMPYLSAPLMVTT